jgi:hypothetical protein
VYKTGIPKIWNLTHMFILIRCSSVLLFGATNSLLLYYTIALIRIHTHFIPVQCITDGIHWLTPHWYEYTETHDQTKSVLCSILKYHLENDHICTWSVLPSTWCTLLPQVEHKWAFNPWKISGVTLTPPLIYSSLATCMMVCKWNHLQWDIYMVQHLFEIQGFS